MGLPVLVSNLTDTWDDAGISYRGIKLDVTDTASQSDSFLFWLSVGGSQKFGVDKNGYIQIGGETVIQHAGSVTTLAAGSVAFSGVLRPQTTTATTPTTTEYPTDKDFGIHYDSGADKLYLTVNRGGSIKALDFDGGGITGWGAGAGNALVPDVAGTDIGAVGNEAGRIYIGRANQKTSSAAPASLTEYPNANDWGIHHDTNADTISLAFNKAGTLQILDLAGGGITGWGAGAGNALVPNVAGTVIGAVGNEAGRIYSNNIIDLTAAGGAARFSDLAVMLCGSMVEVRRSSLPLILSRHSASAGHSEMQNCMARQPISWSSGTARTRRRPGSTTPTPTARTTSVSASGGIRIS